MMTRSMICFVLLIELLRLDLDIPLACRLLLPVLLPPGLEGFACRRIPPSERESSDIGVGDVHFGRRVGWYDANEGIGKRGTGASIEEVAHDLRSVLACDRDIAAIVEGFFQRLTDLGVTRQRRDPPLKLFPLAPRGYFNLIRIFVGKLCPLCGFLRLGRHRQSPETS